MRRALVSKELSWHMLSQPSGEELAEFVRETGMEVLDAEFIAQERQRPEVAVRENYILLLLQIPVFQRVERLTRGVNVHIVVREGAMFTVSFEPLVALEQIFEELEREPEKQEEYFSRTSLLLSLYILRRLLATAFEKLDRLSKHIEIADDAVFHGNERKMVEEIALLTRDVMDFRKIIRPQRRLFSEVPDHRFFQDEASKLWQRLSRQTEKLWDILENLAEGVKQLGKTNYVLLQHKENQLLRLLTLYSMLGIPALLLVSPLFSPGSSEASTLDGIVFWLVFGGLTLSLVGILWWFRNKRVF